MEWSMRSVVISVTTSTKSSSYLENTNKDLVLGQVVNNLDITEDQERLNKYPIESYQ